MEKMSLYEIDHAIEEIMERAVDEETGEIDEGAYAELDELVMAREQKVENIGLAYKSWVAFADSIKAEKLAIEKRQKRAEKKAEWLKGYMAHALGGEKFKTPKVEATYRRSSSVEIYDMGVLPEEYLRYRDPEPDKTKIKEAITKHGETVPGAVIVEHMNISIK